MKKKLEIIQRHLAGGTNRQIARDVGLNRKTVDKYVREWREAQAAVEAADGSDPAAVREAVEAMTGAPAYKKEGLSAPQVDKGDGRVPRRHSSSGGGQAQPPAHVQAAAHEDADPRGDGVFGKIKIDTLA